MRASGEKPLGLHYEAIDGVVHGIDCWFEDINEFTLTCRGRSSVAYDVKCWTTASVTCMHCIAKEK